MNLRLKPFILFYTGILLTLNMCELIITKGQTFTADGEKVYRMTIDQKERDDEILNSPEYHTFYYNPQTNMFSNAACFYMAGKKIFELELQNIWQPSIRDMMLRHRNWVTKENETSRDFMLPLADHETAQKMYPVLTETYLDQVENAWANAI